ncbi:MAG: hypothetical protein AB7Q37_04235 [Pyrinomonadaceae bacterium]
MSISIDYLFNSDLSLDELSDEINKELGTNLRISYPNGKEQSGCIFFGMSLDFYECTRESDGVIDFESFRYQLGFVGRPGIRQLRVPLTAMIGYFLYSRMGISRGLLVYDLQVPLASYVQRLFEDNTEDLFDTISEKQIRFPEHFIEIETRILEIESRRLEGLTR